MALKKIVREELRVERPVWRFKPGLQLKDHLVQRSVLDASGQAMTVHEFIGSDNFAAAFYERQRYEVDSGRDEEPLIYTSFYSITEDATLPANVPVNRLGPAGVVFEKVEEGGEVKFASVGQSNFSVPIYQYAFGLQYTKRLVLFNELWSLPEVERQAGTALNALLNNIHIAPILMQTYGANNQTLGSSLTFDANATLPEKYLRTLEQSIVDSVGDATNPRRGPYVLLVSTANLFTAERALTVVPQQGITQQSSAVSRVNTLVGYDGWTGNRGEKIISYSGVPAGKAYLIDQGLQRRHFRSYVKQGLQRENGNPDVSRFILEQSVWDIWLGSYTDALGGVQEITWPTAA